MKKIFLYFISISYLLFGQNSSNNNTPDPLSETPLYPIPSEMTFEEYRDMNRRLSQAFLWSSIPIPGITHYYAGEKKKAKRLFYIGMGGLACIVGGALSMDEGTWPEYNSNIHVIHNQGTDNEKWYERIPTRMEGDIIHYELKEIRKEQDEGGGGLIFLGIAVIVGDLIYDRLKGFRLIEEKRDRVRYKYGQQIKYSYIPTLYLSGGQYQIGMKFSLGLY
ncbi:MAG: hypothetical protein CMG74_08310 [Candidatus Marinimicrobia bacterium]|nr:hypothetical protein [Candidatus Neomarinimicrobiota bacterium]|tara:strand:+ start:167 stop:826 length:660 start_codon:yes stop_codon:yes gene_type:complete